MLSNTATILAVRDALSAARIGTYEMATGAVGDDAPSALALYAWNALVSGALLAPLHVCEVVIRNAVAHANEAQYGNRWPWLSGFERSLPDPSIGYSPRKDLQNARRHAPTTGKVIPELKFVFWQKMFTARYDALVGYPPVAGITQFGLDSSLSANCAKRSITTWSKFASSETVLPTTSPSSREAWPKIFKELPT